MSIFVVVVIFSLIFDNVSLYIYIYIILPYFKNYIKMNIYTEKYFNSDIELLVIIIFIFFAQKL